jgi:hypothetical protein
MDEDFETEVHETADEPAAIWICQEALWPDVQAQAKALGHVAVALGDPYRDRIIFRMTQGAS